MTGKEFYTDNAYKKCTECGKMKMVGVQCKDPRTGQCDKDPRYIYDVELKPK